MQVNFRAQKLLTRVAIIVAIAFAAVGFSVDAKGFFGNLLAELAGVGVSLAVAALVVDRVTERVQKSNRLAEQIRLHDSLSHLLGFLVEAVNGNPFHWSKHARYSEPLVAQLPLLREMIASIAAGTFQMTPLQRKCVVESADEALESMRSLSPVAFQFSGHQGLLWLSLTNSTAQLAKLFPFKIDSVDKARQPFIPGADAFSLAFCDLLQHMFMFEEGAANAVASNP